MPSLFICLNGLNIHLLENVSNTNEPRWETTPVKWKLSCVSCCNLSSESSGEHNSSFLEEVKTFKLQLIKPLDTTSFFSFWFVKNRRNTIENKFILPNKDREEPKNQW